MKHRTVSQNPDGSYHGRINFQSEDGTRWAYYRTRRSYLTRYGARQFLQQLQHEVRKTKRKGAPWCPLLDLMESRLFLYPEDSV